MIIAEREERSMFKFFVLFFTLLLTAMALAGCQLPMAGGTTGPPVVPPPTSAEV